MPSKVYRPATLQHVLRGCSFALHDEKQQPARDRHRNQPNHFYFWDANAKIGTWCAKCTQKRGEKGKSKGESKRFHKTKPNLVLQLWSEKRYLHSNKRKQSFEVPYFLRQPKIWHDLVVLRAARLLFFVGINSCVVRNDIISYLSIAGCIYCASCRNSRKSNQPFAYDYAPIFSDTLLRTTPSYLYKTGSFASLTLFINRSCSTPSSLATLIIPG